MIMPLSRVLHRLLRSRTRCGTVRLARLRTVVLIRHGRREPGGTPSRPRAGIARWSRIRTTVSTRSPADPATRRDRCRGVLGTIDGAAAAAAPGNSSRWWGVTTTAGAGESPAPWTSDNVVTGPADSAAPSAPTGVGEAMTAWVSTHRRCALSEPMSTAESGPPSATPNWSKTVRDNRRQPVTTSGEDSFGRVSPCERPAASAHRNPITYGASEAEVTRDNRYSGDIGSQPISV